MFNTMCRDDLSWKRQSNATFISRRWMKALRTRPPCSKAASSLKNTSRSPRSTLKLCLIQFVFDVYWSSGTRFERDTGRYCMGAALFGNFLKTRKSLFVTSKSAPTIKYWYVFQSIGMWAHPRTVGRAIEALPEEYGVVTFWKTWKNDEKRSFQLSRQLHRVLTPIWASQWPVPRYFWWCLGI